MGYRSGEFGEAPQCLIKMVISQCPLVLHNIYHLFSCLTLTCITFISCAYAGSKEIQVLGSVFTVGSKWLRLSTSVVKLMGL